MQRRSFITVVCGAIASFFFPHKKVAARVDSLSASSKSVMLGLKDPQETGVSFVDKSQRICDFCGKEATNMHVGSKLTGHIEDRGCRWATWESTKAQFFCDGCDWQVWLQDFISLPSFSKNLLASTSHDLKIHRVHVIDISAEIPLHKISSAKALPYGSVFDEDRKRAFARSIFKKEFLV